MAKIYTVNGSNVNLRSGPGTSFSSGGLLQKGDEVENIPIPEKNENNEYNENAGKLSVSAEGYVWYYVHVLSGGNKGNNGYVASGYLT